MNYINFITQQDEICYACGKDLPKGSNCMIDEEQAILCPSCFSQADYGPVPEQEQTNPTRRTKVIDQEIDNSWLND